MGKSEQNIDGVYNNTGSNITESKVDKSTTRIMKATGDLPEEKKGYAKASPKFEKVKPDDKVVASEEEQKKAIENNIIEEELDDNSDQS